MTGAPETFLEQGEGTPCRRESAHPLATSIVRHRLSTMGVTPFSLWERVDAKVRFWFAESSG